MSAEMRGESSSSGSARGSTPMKTWALQAHALEKLRDHWTAHMDQYDTVSHRQLDSGLPYLIDSQATDKSLPLLMHPPRSTDSDGSALFGRNITPVHAPLYGNSGPSSPRNASNASYDISSSWYPGSNARFRTATDTTSNQRYADEHIQSMRRAGDDAQVALSPESPLDSISGEAQVRATDLAPVIPPDWSVVSRHVPKHLLPLFQQSTTRDQPHLDILREHRRQLLQEHEEQRGKAPKQEVGHKRKAPNAALTEAERRANHTASEQKRRANIRKSYERLCELMPSIHDGDGQLASELSEGRTSTRSELVILEHAVNEIEQKLILHHSLLQRKADLQRKLLARYLPPS